MIVNDTGTGLGDNKMVSKASRVVVALVVACSARLDQR